MSTKDPITFTFGNEEVTIPMNREREFLETDNIHEVGNEGELSWRVLRIQSEFVRGHDFLRNYDRAVTIFGSARQNCPPEIYEETTKLAHMLAKEGFAIFSGGGPGIMEAANKGAYEAGGRSVGININLPGKDGATERRNAYITEAESFDYFFSRKVILSFASQFYIACPGGFGTMDELFEMLTLVQTGKTSPVPVVLMGKDFWEPLTEWIKNTMLEQYGTISEKDLNLFYLVDTADEAYEYITGCLGGVCPVQQ